MATEAETRYRELVEAGAPEDVALQAIQQIPGYSDAVIKSGELTQKKNEIQAGLDANAGNVSTSVDEAMPGETITGTTAIGTGTNIADTSANGDITSLSQLILSERERLKEEKAQIQTEAEKVKGKVDSGVSLLGEQVSGQASTEEKRAKLSTELGVPELESKLDTTQAEIISLNKKIADNEAAFNRGVLRIENKPIAMEFIAGETSALKKEFNIEQSALTSQLGIKVAEAEMYLGRIESVNETIDKTIDAMTYDTRQKIEDTKYFLEYYSGYYDTLSSDLKKNISESVGLLESQLTIDKEDYQEKFNWLKTAWENGIDPGITAEDIKTMTLEDIATKVGKKIATLPTKRETAVIVKDGRQVLIDTQTGTTIKDLGVSEASEEQNEAFSVEMDTLNQFGNREEVADYITRNEFSLKNVMGADNYQKYLDRVDELFPLPQSRKTEAQIEEERKQRAKVAKEEAVATGTEFYIDENGNLISVSGKKVGAETGTPSTGFFDSLFSF